MYCTNCHFVAYYICFLQASYIRATCDKSGARFRRIECAVYLVISGKARPLCESLFPLHTCHQNISSQPSLVPDDYSSNTLLTISTLQLVLSYCFNGESYLSPTFPAYSTSKQLTPASCNHCVKSITANLLINDKIASNEPLAVEHTLGTPDQDSAILGFGGFHPIVEHLCPPPSNIESWLYRSKGQTPVASVA